MKNAPFDWKEEQQAAFDDIKSALTSEPLLCFPDLTRPFTVECDASRFALGAVLSQTQRNGQLAVIQYASRSLNKAERNYDATSRELLAVDWALRVFPPYLRTKADGGRLDLVVVDHRPLLALNASSHCKFARYLVRYDIKICHRPGKSHSNVDSLTVQTVTINRKSLLLEQSKDGWISKLSDKTIIDGVI